MIFIHGFSATLYQVKKKENIVQRTFHDVQPFEFHKRRTLHDFYSLLLPYIKLGGCKLNPLRPGIKLQILLLCDHPFLTEVVGRSC